MQFRVVALERGSQLDSGVVTNAPLVAGRAEVADIVFRDAAVANTHAMLWSDHSDLWIRDLGSRAGTWVNGHRIQGARVIEEDDSVVLGEASRLQVVPVPVKPLDPDTRPYRLEARSTGPRGIEATLSDPVTGNRVALVTDNRAVLLYLMARKQQQDRQQGERAGGWLAAEDAIKGLWGRAGMDKGTNRLDVLLYRLRRKVSSCGLDAACIVKRNGHLRIAVEDVSVG